MKIKAFLSFCVSWKTAYPVTEADTRAGNQFGVSRDPWDGDFKS